MCPRNLSFAMSDVEPPPTPSLGPSAWERIDRHTPPPPPPRRTVPSTSSISSPHSGIGEDAKDVDDLLEGIDRVRIDDLWSTPLSARASPTRADVPTPVAPNRATEVSSLAFPHKLTPGPCNIATVQSRLSVQTNACQQYVVDPLEPRTVHASEMHPRPACNAANFSYQSGLFGPPARTGIAAIPMAHVYPSSNFGVASYPRNTPAQQSQHYVETPSSTVHGSGQGDRSNPQSGRNNVTSFSETCSPPAQALQSHHFEPFNYVNSRSFGPGELLNLSEDHPRNAEKQHMASIPSSRSSDCLHDASKKTPLFDWARNVSFSGTNVSDSFVSTSSSLDSSVATSPHDILQSMSGPVFPAANPSNTKLTPSDERTGTRGASLVPEEDGHEFPRHFKVFPCPNASMCTATGSQSECFFYHSSSDDRRRENCSSYKPHMCRFVEEMGGCRKGDRCPFSHNDFERRYHPDRFGKETCRDFLRGDCPRKYCTFRHEVSGKVELAISQIDSMNDKELLQLVLKICETQGRSLSDKLMRRFGHSKKHSGWRLEGFNPQGRDDQKVKYISMRVDGLKKMLRIAGEKKWAATLKMSSLRDMMSGCRKVAEEIRERFKDDCLRRENGNEMHRLIRAVFSTTNWSCHSQEGDNPFLVTPDNQNDAVTALERLVEVALTPAPSQHVSLSSLSSSSTSSLPSSTTSSPPLTTLSAPVAVGNVVPHYTSNPNILSVPVENEYSRHGGPLLNRGAVLAASVVEHSYRQQVWGSTE